VCFADAEEVTLIRTAAASAVATEALSRPESSRLAVLGSGRQAVAHAVALSQVRRLEKIVVWGRTRDRAESAAERIADLCALDVSAADDVATAVADADLICTTTSAPNPILLGNWVRPGTHINLVGSSGPSTAEADNDLVCRASFFVDSTQSALAQAGEFLRTKATGRIRDDHIRAEIGSVLLGRHPGRCEADEITIYKSLGHAAQDLKATAYLYERCVEKN